ncbi:NAD(P)H-hydrate dehydratase [Shimia sp. Alg240-R146]|uniref:NAD(P)H-hydrate dehydratase n=1 Tax=Shimia sp. Alg240-R146 TaxID=2993449 RepID=UPI0022E3BDB6|nr:NAD(P)H-hydrate dehydratase [Shimia sp. Alg240-R146]
MSELLTAAQMRAIEQAAIESGEVTGLELMERAGQGVVEAILEEWPELGEEGGAAPNPAEPDSPRGNSGTKKRAVVLCGPGNNGGDGFVVARLLKERGWDVEVFLYGDAEKVPPDARVNYERWLEIGAVEALEEFTRSNGWQCDVLVDALFGTGLKRGLQELGNLFWNMEDMVDCFDVEFGHERGRPAIVAVDIPSGVCADSGCEFEHEEVWHRFSAAAHLTITFHRAKVGHFLGEGAERRGELRVVDIGLEDTQSRHLWVKNCAPEVGDDAALWRVARRSLVKEVGPIHPSLIGKDTDDHKYSHGHALILSGGSGKSGAARLAARGALRIGAGLVTLGVPPSAQQEVACQITALMLTRIGDATALDVVLADQRINALCLGPGMGLERARELVPGVLAAKRATVLDADALSAFEDAPEELFEMLHADCVLTPHGGEFAKLFPDIAAKLAEVPTKGPAYSKVDATREATARAGCVVLFKGADTVIADPSGRCAVNAAVYERAAPWLATAGSGDVLAGFITGLLARGFAPMAAAETGAWLHVECARAFGPGLIAEDLPEVLPQVLRDLEVQ